MKAGYRILIVLLAVAGAAVLFKALIGGSTVALFMPQGPIAAQQIALIKTAVFLMLCLALPTLAVLYTIAWKYRAGNEKANRDAESNHNPFRELLLWVLPATLVAILAVITWRSAHALDPYQPLQSQSSSEPLVIQVVALEWKWLFIYPKQNIATVNFLEIPAQMPVRFELTADAPMSSFWIPQLGSQIYAMSAMETQLNLMANTTGDFVGKDTEINGEGYAGMQFPVKSVSQADFDAWVASVQQGSSSTLDSAQYDALIAPTENDPPAFYASTTPGLFDAIMMKFMEPAGMSMPGVQMPDQRIGH